MLRGGDGACQHSGVLGSAEDAVEVVVDERFDFERTLGPQRQFRSDPTAPGRATTFWRAARTPCGAGTLCLRRVARERVRAEAWGPGGPWLLEGVPALLGVEDQPASWTPTHPRLAEAHRRHPGLRIGRSRLVLHALVPAICAQRVTGLEAGRSWRALVRLSGAAAPGPLDGLRLPPDWDVLAQQPYWWYHRCGLERRRAETIVRVCRAAARLEAAGERGAAALAAAVTAVPGCSAWTAAETTGPAAGDPDAVPVGDYHVPNLVSWGLAGEPRGTDARMLELLAPEAGHRGRAIRLLGATVGIAPRFGPRQRIVPIAHR